MLYIKLIKYHEFFLDLSMNGLFISLTYTGTCLYTILIDNRFYKYDQCFFLFMSYLH